MASTTSLDLKMRMDVHTRIKGGRYTVAAGPLPLFLSGEGADPSEHISDAISEFATFLVRTKGIDWLRDYLVERGAEFSLAYDDERMESGHQQVHELISV